MGLWDLGFGVQGLGFGALGFRVWCFGFRGLGLKASTGDMVQASKCYKGLYSCMGVDSVGLDRVIQGYFELERVIKGVYRGHVRLRV